MQFQVTYIDFDFDEYDDAYPDELDDNYKQQITEETIDQIWEAIDGDDLVEQITGWFGWCIKSIDYHIILK